MIVDDDKEFLKEFEEMLNLSGYQNRTFPNGEAALKAVKSVQPDLILLDLRMDGKSGFEVVYDLRKDPATHDIPVIAISAFYTNEDCRRLIKEFNVRKVLVKPIKPLDVISEIESVFADNGSST
ncbi:MAG: response regulator [Candidatus Omnitrophota bacterium]